MDERDEMNFRMSQALFEETMLSIDAIEDDSAALEYFWSLPEDIRTGITGSIFFRYRVVDRMLDELRRQRDLYEIASPEWSALHTAYLMVGSA